MSELHLGGNCKYSGHSEYDNLNGRVVSEFTVKRVDSRRNCTIWTTYEVIDLGRADAIAPMDVDAALQPERLANEHGAQAWQQAGSATLMRKAAERQAKVENRIVQYLSNYGPADIKTLAAALGCKRSLLDYFMRLRDGTTFRRAGMMGRSIIWDVECQR